MEYGRFAVGFVTGVVVVAAITYVTLPKIARRSGVRAISNQLSDLGVTLPNSVLGIIGDKIEHEVKRSVF